MPELLVQLLLALGVFGISVALTWALRRPGGALYLLDHPSERSLHSEPTPRTGGVAIVTAIALGLAIGSWLGLRAPGLAWLALGAGLVAAISLVDDWLDIAPGYRITVHFLAAALVVHGGFTVSTLMAPGGALALPAWLAVPVTVLFVVWMLNLYNFMDGMDGLAGGMAVFGFGCYALLGWSAGNDAFALASLTVGAAAAGFLVFNFPPASIFMGDVGSSVLGYLAGAGALWGVRDGVFPAWIPLLVFSPFIVDATVTLGRRLVRGERVWEAHKTHYYQRLVQLGWGHRRTVLWEYVLMLVCAVIAWIANAFSYVGQTLILALSAAAYVVLMAAVHWLERRERRITAS